MKMREEVPCCNEKDWKNDIYRTCARISVSADSCAGSLQFYEINEYWGNPWILHA